MKAYIIIGNTRARSNTADLAQAFADVLAAEGMDVTQISLRGLHINACVGCDRCHGVLDAFGCVTDDDMQAIAKEMLASDLIVLASPIYTWMPTPPLKAVMDRFYAFTKYPEDGEAFNLLAKQKIAMVATSGDECETNCDLFDEAVRRMAKFGKIPYLGYLAARDRGDGDIVKPDIREDARAFAKLCAEAFK